MALEKVVKALKMAKELKKAKMAAALACAVGASSFGLSGLSLYNCSFIEEEARKQSWAFDRNVPPGCVVGEGPYCINWMCGNGWAVQNGMREFRMRYGMSVEAKIVDEYLAGCGGPSKECEVENWKYYVLICPSQPGR
jgi:hypothetical protein